MRREFEFKVEHNKSKDGVQVHEICNQAEIFFRIAQKLEKTQGKWWIHVNFGHQRTHSISARFAIIDNAELGSDLKLDEEAKPQFDWIAEQEERSSNFPSSEENGVGHYGRGSTTQSMPSSTII